MKKLGHNEELQSLDHHIRLTSGLVDDSYTDVSEAIKHYTQKNVIHEYKPDVQGSSGQFVDHLSISKIHGHMKNKQLAGSEMLVCPSQRKLDLIENKVVENNLGINRLTVLHNIMTILLLNSEPLLFQVFRCDAL